jgi:putative transposase
MMIELSQVVESKFILLSMPTEGRALVRQMLTGVPARTVQARRGNSIIKYYSRKMKRHIRLESRRGEYARARMLEDRADVLAYFPQCFTVDLILRGKDDRATGRTSYTPDFGVITVEGFDVEETRDEAQIHADSLRSEQFYRGEDGHWHYRAAEEHFTRMGIGYNFISNSSMPATYITNTCFLENYLLEEADPVEGAVSNLVLERLKEKRWLPLSEAVSDPAIGADAVFKLIAEGEIYADLYHDRLDVTGDVFIYPDKATCEAHRILRQSQLEPPLPIPGSVHIAPGTPFSYNGVEFLVLLSTDKEVVARDPDGHTQAFPISTLAHIHDFRPLESARSKHNDVHERTLSQYGEGDIKRALKRREALRANDTSEFSARTLARYAAATSLAQNEVEVLLALIDDNGAKGNRKSRLPILVEELAERAIRESYNRKEAGSKLGAYGSYTSMCTEASTDESTVLPMSYTSFCRRCSVLEDVRSREGKRVAYQKRAINVVMDQAYPIHGTRPHDVVCIDHTIAPIALISPNGVGLGKPTFTLAIDAHVCCARAFILSFDPPSAKTVLMLLRDYVRRHGRLPRTILVDNGKEFHSRELELFCNIYNIEIRYRAPGMPRGAAMIERGLGVVEQEVFGELEGNTRQLHDPRLVTASVNGFNHAVWTLPALWGMLNEYLFNIQMGRIHPTLGKTPTEFEAERLMQTGSREHMFVRFDENLMLMTCPHTKKPHHNVDRRRGIWANSQWYWNTEMSALKDKTSLEVRQEPWNGNVIYVCIKNRWVAAVARNLRPYAGRTSREVEIALREEKRLAVQLASKDKKSPRQLEKKERLWSPETFDVRINLQQREMYCAFEKLGMVEAIKVEGATLKFLASPQLALPAPLSQDSVANVETSSVALHVPAVSNDQASPSIQASPLVASKNSLLAGVAGLL